MGTQQVKLRDIAHAGHVRHLLQLLDRIRASRIYIGCRRGRTGCVSAGDARGGLSCDQSVGVKSPIHRPDKQKDHPRHQEREFDHAGATLPMELHQ